MALRLATEATETIDLGDDAWVKVRKDISKRSMNRLLAHMPKRSQDDLKKTGLTIDEGLDFQVGLFAALVTDWSVEDDAGNKVLPTEEAYLGILREDAEELDMVLAKHFEALMPTKDEQGKP